MLVAAGAVVVGPGDRVPADGNRARAEAVEAHERVPPAPAPAARREADDAEGVRDPRPVIAQEPGHVDGRACDGTDAGRDGAVAVGVGRGRERHARRRRQVPGLGGRRRGHGDEQDGCGQDPAVGRREHVGSFHSS